MRSNFYSRRDFLKGMGWGMVSMGLTGCMTSSNHVSMGTVKPNIIIIMADDLGYGDVGCYGSSEIKTPNIDALAAGGMRFTDFHSNGAVCSPTRAALLTGRYQQRCGIEGVVTAKNHRHTGMALEEVTFAEVLKRAGYTTGLMGKWHLGYGVAFNPVKQGFDYFRGYVSGNVDYHSHIDQEGHIDWWQGAKLEADEGYSTDLITEYGVRFIERNKNKPFCLYLAHEAPHYPMQGRRDRPVRAPGRPRAFDGVKDRRRAYKEMIEVMDEGVGKIVQKVKKLGLEEKTLIFFFSDNGPAALGSAGGLRGKKGTLWEGGHRVPAVAYWPGRVTGGSECSETVLSMDLFPTMMSVAGMAVDTDLKLDGVDCLGVLTEGKKLPARALFWKHGVDKAIRKGNWKLLVRPASKRRKPINANDQQEEFNLFDLKTDRAEKNNLADIQPERAKKMRAELAAWEKEVLAGVEKRS